MRIEFLLLPSNSGAALVLSVALACFSEGGCDCQDREASHAHDEAHLSQLLDAVGTGIAVQQKLMRHSDIRTTLNVYGDVIMDEMAQAHTKVVGLALNGAQTERKAS